MEMKTHHNGELRLSHAGQSVTLVGWVAKKRNLGSLFFIDLRDREGITQIICSEELASTTSQIRNEYVIRVHGTVAARKDANPALATGAIEVAATAIEIINTAETTPLIIADETDALEDTRMKYRYLDLRRPVMQKMLKERHQITKTMRAFLDDHGFIEVETPVLTKSTPEGARDYLVPSRVHPGEFYALPQSPQLFKQLLMIAGFERYYQVARCFRDEDLRADRQLDFTQVDIEMSFLSEHEIRSMMEQMIVRVMKEIKGMEITTPFPSLTWNEAMNRYGNDKPDTRFGMELQDVTGLFKASEFKVFQDAIQNKGAIKAIVVPNKADMTRKEVDALTDLAKKYKAKGLVSLKVTPQGIEGSAAKFLSEEEKTALIQTLQASENDLILIISDTWDVTCDALGTLRSHLGRQLGMIDDNQFNYLWVVDFPLLEYNEEDGRYYAKHHPFTRPKEEQIPLLDSNPKEVLACAYDMVLNGFEIGGGSLRIFDQNLQSKMFEVLGFTKEQIKERFGFFIDAFQYGTPPHGGIAFGLDRLAMVLANASSIRDVIAFPKNASARCPMSDAPSPVETKQLDELHIKIVG